MKDSVKQFFDAAEPLALSRYAKAMEAFSTWAYDKHKHNLKPQQVAQAVLKALQARHPKTRYRLGWDSRAVALASWLLPDRIYDWLILWIASLPLRFGKWKDQ
jgi:hypothetical protein